MSEMSWQLRHPEYGLMRIDLEAVSYTHLTLPTKA